MTHFRETLGKVESVDKWMLQTRWCANSFTCPTL